MKKLIILIMIAGFIATGAIAFGAGITPTADITLSTQVTVGIITLQGIKYRMYKPGSVVPTANATEISQWHKAHEWFATHTPTPIITPRPGDLQADISNTRVKFSWHPDASFNPKRLPSNSEEIISQKTVGYVFVVAKKGTADIISEKAYLFDNYPIDLELSDFDANNEYTGKIFVILNYHSLFKKSDGTKMATNVYYLNYGAMPIEMKIPPNFISKADSPLKTNIQHVSLAELYNNRDKYVGKVIEVGAYVNKYGPIAITSRRYKSEYPIGDDKYSLYVERGGVSELKKLDNLNYVNIIGYFYKKPPYSFSYSGSSGETFHHQVPVQYYLLGLATNNKSNRQ